MKKRKYSIGLDIGTASVGWACISDDYELLNFREKPAFGVHVFDSADTAETRRLQRGMRRRYNRRVKRIQMLQEIFAPLIGNDNFFALMSDKHRWQNNNDFENRTLSETLLELGYSREEIHHRFPTIYHLRYELINSKEKFDLRLIYLALHNLVKFRGHFLLGNISWEDREEKDPVVLLENFFNKYSEVNDREETIDILKLQKIDNILSESTKTNNDKKIEISKLLPGDYKEVSKLLTGLKANAGRLFFESENAEELKEEGLSFKLSDDPENIDFTLLNDVQEETVQLAQEIFLDYTLKEILGTATCISHAKVTSFKRNKKQLEQLRDFIYKNYGSEEGKRFFTSAKENIVNYEKRPDKKNLEKLSFFDQYRLSKQNGKEKFFKEVRKLLKKEKVEHFPEKEQEIAKEINTLIENDEFLQFLVNVSNASIPYQNSTYEAKKILKNQSRFHSGLSNELIEKVNQLISFRIPYYIGPLTKEKDPKFGWLERAKNETITPFNFEEAIDKGTSAERFIKNMTNKCSYLLEEDVLPKNSLLYQEMEVLNELNSIQLRNSTENSNKVNRLPQEIKKLVYENHFKNNKKVTHKNLKEFLERSTNGYEEKNIFGTQKENQFASSLSTYIDFKDIFGKEMLEHHIREIEVIISWITIFNEKSIIREKIKDNFEFISEEQIEKILKLDYKGWGRISEKALTLESNGDTIIDLMRTDDYNFMEALTSSKHDFKNQFEKINKQNKNGKSINYSDIEKLKCSPALKKSIWASVKIIEELVKIFGEPDNIVLEFAREEGEKGRNKSREEQWSATVKENQLKKKEEFKEVFQNIAGIEKDIDYDHPMAMLYLRQGGRCLYTLEKIHPSSIFNNDGTVKNTGEYEIDHILPRNFVKDDSFDNKALVIKRANQQKSGHKMPLTIPMNDTPKKKWILREYWDKLVDNGMISAGKRNKLMKEEFSDQDKESFIARQLVETRQITVHVRNLLEEMFCSNNEEKVSVEVLKAGIVTEVRRSLEIPKMRELNDYHHAVDALLVAGTFMFGEELLPNMFKFDFRKEKAQEKWKQINAGNHTKNDFNKELFLTSSMKRNNIKPDKTFKYLMQEIIENNKPNVTKKVGSSEGAFYKQSIFSPKVESPNYESNKTNRFVHKEIKKSFAILIEYYVSDKKGAFKKKIELLDTNVIELAQNDFQNDEELARYYAEKSSGEKDIINPKVGLKIYKNDLIYFKGEPFYFNSSGELINAKQLVISSDLEKSLNEQYYKKHNYDTYKAETIYNELARSVINQHQHILPESLDKREEKIEKILNYFNDTKKGYNDFINCINELLKVSSPSSTRSETLGGRFTRASKKIVESSKYSTTSITGLKYKKPKALVKFLEE